uniref:DUF1394 domain-containing protein n=1 Tax=Caenorhabditis tropicalis TaxID=1561998 RepID=A0A1I7UP73_9PELO
MTEGGEPTAEQALEAKEEVRKEQQDLMDELTEHDHITRFFKNKCFAFADEADQTAAISSLINCEDKFVEAYMVTVGKVYQESRKRVCTHYKNVRTMYLFLTAEESLMDTDGHRINSLVGFIGTMYNCLLKLRSDALTLCEAIRQIKTSQSSSFFPLHKSASFHRVWKHIAEIMFQFAIVDHLAALFPELGVKFCDFQNKFRRIKKHFEVDFSPAQRKAYDEGAKAQEDAQSMILKGNCFRTLYESSAGDMDNNGKFAGEMKDAIGELLVAWEKTCTQGTSDIRFFCGISALTVYYYHHFSNFIDYSLIRKVVQASKKVPFYRFLGEELFVPMEFMRKECSNKLIFDSKLENLAKKLMTDAIAMAKEKSSEMVKEIEDYCGYAETWKTEFLAKKREQTEAISKLSQWGLDIAELYLKCIRILEVLSRDIHLLIRSKRGEDRGYRIEIDRTTAYALLGGIETIKKMEFFILENWGTIEEGSFLARQQWRKHMLRILLEARKSYVNSKSKSTTVIEAATKRSFYHIAEAQCINEMNASRNVVLTLAYEIGRLETHISNADRKHVQDLMNRLEIFNSPRQLLTKAAYTGLLTTHTWLPHMYFDALIHRRPELDAIEGFCSALGGFVEGAKETGQSVKLISRLKDTVDSTLIVKMASQIDLDLRILGNCHLTVGEIEQNDILDEEMEYIGYLIKTVKQFQVGTTIVSIADSLREWLEDQWYSMEILAPNNAKTYTRMQQIARTKYGLELLDADFPQADIDETVIILDILRNFSSFCTNYNFFSQGYMFIERASESKRLHIIRITDLKTAVRKHGVGILPTAVNSAYQLIRNKIQTLLAFLAEDTVRYQILKHLHEMEANKSSGDSKKKPHYKVSWAANVLKNLAKQNLAIGGVVAGSSQNEDGTEATANDLVYTYFDKFRSLITQIGNAISLIRLLCQAAREVHNDRQDLFASIKKHMEDLEATSRGLHITTRRGSPVNLTRVHATYRLGLVKEMFERVSEQRNYTKMLCVEFKSLLMKSKLPEDKIEVLDYFHGVIPALTLSHVNYMMAHETRVKKLFAMKHNKDLVVTEDGFASGIAFLLHALDGWDSWFKLNWFDSFTLMKEHEIKTQSESREYTQSVQLKMERLQTELKIFTNFKMNFGIQHTIFTMS